MRKYGCDGEDIEMKFVTLKNVIFVALTMLIATSGAQVTLAAIITSVERHNPDNNSDDTEPEMVAGGLREGVPNFVDRQYVYVNVPPGLVGIDYVKVANDDKDNRNYQLDVTVGKNAALMLFIDWRVGDDDNSNPPILGGGIMDWVGRMGFTDTGLRIDVDENGDLFGDNFLSVYVLNVPAGTTTTVLEQNDGQTRNMYCVAAQSGGRNLPPLVEAGDYQAILWPFKTFVQLDATVTDDDPCGLSLLTMRWSLLSGPGPVAFSPGDNIEDPCAIFERPGVYDLLLQAWDEVPQESNDVVTIMVKESSSEDLILESSVLRLGISENPYSFKITEKATSEILISQNQTTFKLPGGTCTAVSAYNITKSSSSIGADLLLRLNGEAGVGHVEFSLQSPDLIQVVLTCRDETPSNIGEEFVDQGEHYYGIWEYPLGGNIDNRGADHDLLGFGGMPYTNFSNARAPFYVTSGKYGIYVDTVKRGQYSIALNAKTGFDFDEESLKYYIIYGPSYDNIMNTFNQLAGPAWMPPDWAFDSIWWRDDDHRDIYPEDTHWDLVENRLIESGQDNVQATANHLQYYRIPASAIWIDRPFTSGTWGWGNMEFNPDSDWFPDGQAMIDSLEVKGYKLLLWIANRCGNELYTEGSSFGYLFSGNWPAADVRRQEVYDWFKGKLDTFVSMGVRGYKIDRGHEGEQPLSAENEVVYLFRELAAEGQMERHGEDYLIHARNCYDRNRRHIGVWNGDTSSDFGGLSVSIKNGLRCGAINFPYYGSDTGGYMSDYPGKELFARWLQFSTYCTMMEILIDPGRTVWYDSDFGHNEHPSLIDIARKQCQDHHDLIPYTKSCMFIAHQTGMPVMRQLIFAYPHDDNLYDMWDEYLYGPEILVAPVIRPGAVSRSVYLPAGKWLDYNSKDAVYTGPDTIIASAPLDVIPLFVRAGAIIPRGDILRSNNNWTSRWSPYLRIEFFPCENTSHTFDYYSGSQVQTISCSMTANGLVNIQFGHLGYDGDLKIYCRGYATVKNSGVALADGADFTYDANEMLLTIPFDGVTAIEITGVTSMFDVN